MSEAAADEGAFSGNFMFVGNLANDAKSGKQIRSHLMREYYRKERWKKCLSHRSRPGLDWKPRKDGQVKDGSPTAKRDGGKRQTTSQKASKRVRTAGTSSAVPQATQDVSSTVLPPLEEARSVSNETLPPLTIPTSQSRAMTPYTANRTPAPLTPEQLPEPLFCPPQPKRSDDLSAASETAFSMYSPGGTMITGADAEMERAKAKARKKIRSLAEDFYVRRPSLCGSPGSEIYVSPFGYLPIKLNPTDHSILQYCMSPSHAVGSASLILA